MKEFSNKVALVTGGGSGIGRATSIAFGEAGARVVVADLPNSDGAKTAETIRSNGGDASFVEADVSNTTDVKKIIQHCEMTYGGLDIAFNNAGIEGSVFVPTADYDEDIWDKVIDVNLKGVWLCVKYQIPALLARGGGAIVNMSSIAGISGGTVGVGYYASKHGVIGITRAAAKEYASQGIRINAVCPAVIRTPLSDRAFGSDEEAKSAIDAMHKIGRSGTPEEVASAVLWLCSDGASFVTGTALKIDGGFLD